MKKLILLLLLISANSFSQKFTKDIFYNSTNNIITVNYIDELNQIKSMNIPVSSLHGTDSTQNKKYLKLVQDRLDTIAIAKATVSNIYFSTNNTTANGIFFIVGQFYNAKPVKVGQLSGADLTLVNNFFAFCATKLGTQLTYCEINGTVKLNATTYNLTDIDVESGGLITQLKAMCKTKFNP